MPIPRASNRPEIQKLDRVPEKSWIPGTDRHHERGAVADRVGRPPDAAMPSACSVWNRFCSYLVDDGMYDAAGHWAYEVGVPAKSGVSGGILAVIPGKMGIGVFSPGLDAYGNSVRGIRVCEEVSNRLGLHVFATEAEDEMLGPSDRDHRRPRLVWGVSLVFELALRVGLQPEA